MRYETEEDRSKQDETAELLGRALSTYKALVNFKNYGGLHPLDWYSEENGAISGHWEIKTRKIARCDGKFVISNTDFVLEDVFFEYRKWFNLLVAEVFSGIPGFIAYRFDDERIDGRECAVIGYAAISELPIREIRLRSNSGRTAQTRTSQDIQPCFDLSFALLDFVEVELRRPKPPF